MDTTLPESGMPTHHQESGREIISCKLHGFKTGIWI